MNKRLWQRLFVLFIILPALSSFVTVIWGSSLIFIMDYPLFEMAINSIEFKIGLLSANIGYLFVEIMIFYLCFNYIFKPKENKSEANPWKTQNQPYAYIVKEQKNMIKVKEFGSSLIFEQLGRISIAGVSMWVVALLEINKISESIAMITILIWMILPTINMFECVEPQQGDKGIKW